MRKPKIQFFKSAAGKWRWRLVAVNGRVLCTPGEDFSSRAKARHNLDCVRSALVTL
jgi:uncharacterized protein YegP (UPF0339 family)